LFCKNTELIHNLGSYKNLTIKASSQLDRFAANNNVIAMVGRLNERIAQMKSELKNNLGNFKKMPQSIESNPSDDLSQTSTSKMRP
jgi:hypothetical protein